MPQLFSVLCGLPVICTCDPARSSTGVEHHVQLPPGGGIVASMDAAHSEVVGHL